MRFIKLLLSLSIVALALLSCSTPEKRADVSMQAILNDYYAAGIQAVVVKENKIVYDKAFGYKDVENKLPLQTTDYMRIASISKSFTATAFMQLVEQEKVSLDADVSNLIGFTVRNPHHPEAVITLRMLLSHTSSIKDKDDYFTIDHLNPAVYGDCIESYYEYAPGEEYNYSNMGLNFAGTILEKITNVRFDEYVYEHVMKPLGLYANHNNDFMDPSRKAIIYEVSENGADYEAQPGAYKSRKDDMDNYIMGYTAPWFSPTGGVKIPAHDLARYMCMHMNYGEYDGVRIISEESSKLMQTPVLESSGYGLCLENMNDYIDGLELKGHTGSAYGLNSIIIFSPEEKWGITVMTNGWDSTKGSLIRAAVKALYEAYIK